MSKNLGFALLFIGGLLLGYTGRAIAQAFRVTPKDRMDFRARQFTHIMQAIEDHCLEETDSYAAASVLWTDLMAVAVEEEYLANVGCCTTPEELLAYRHLLFDLMFEYKPDLVR
jgi:hypothetical protein